MQLRIMTAKHIKTIIICATILLCGLFALIYFDKITITEMIAFITTSASIFLGREAYVTNQKLFKSEQSK